MNCERRAHSDGRKAQSMRPLRRVALHSGISGGQPTRSARRLANLIELPRCNRTKQPARRRPRHKGPDPEGYIARVDRAVAGIGAAMATEACSNQPQRRLDCMCAQHQPKSIKLVVPLGNCRKFSCSSCSMASCSCACVWMNIALSCSASFRSRSLH